MFRIRYTFVRPIVAIVTLAFLAATIFVAQNTGGVVALLALTVASALSWINPPGILGWLIQGACPYCDGRVVWEIRQEPEPYYEIIVARCENGDWSQVEFSYQPH